MLIYFIRHGEAGERDSERWPDDSLRPLTKKGERQFGKAAEGLTEIAAPVEVVLSSPWKRAWDSSLILEREAGWPSPTACEELAQPVPEVTIPKLRALGVESVALVGHEPNLGRLATWLLSSAYGQVIELEKGGIACIEAPPNLGAGSGQVRFVLTPRMLRRLR
jgi:phosphohistidine phosphatase